MRNVLVMMCLRDRSDVVVAHEDTAPRGFVTLGHPTPDRWIVDRPETPSQARRHRSLNNLLDQRCGSTSDHRPRLPRMPSRLHAVYARVVPRVRKAEEMGGPEPEERARVVRWHATLDRSFPTRAVPAFHRRFAVVREELPGFPAYVVTHRRRTPTRTLLYLHGGGYMSPLDPFHVRYITRLATALGARVVVPDYPLAPEHTWRDSHQAIAELTARWAAEPGGVALVGDSSGGGYALAVAITLRDLALPQATHLVLHAPWVDLTTSTPETDAYDDVDPWLFIGKLRAYARWWAGSAEDLGRPEVSPALADLTGLPPALMFCGTRDLLVPGCRLLARRAVEAGWPLTYLEQPDLIHAFPMLPFLPEARVAFKQTVDFLR
jgi:acetyl esterase/lipase